MDIFLMCLLVLIGAVALIGILMAVKLMRYVEENKDKFADDFDVELEEPSYAFLSHRYILRCALHRLCDRVRIYEIMPFAVRMLVSAG